MKGILKEHGATALIYVLLAVGVWWYNAPRRAADAKTAEVMAGPVRGNEDTRVFHVPTCPQYDSIKPGNVREFPTVRDAKAARFEPSTNCLTDIRHRLAYENGEGDDQDDGSYEDPRN